MKRRSMGLPDTAYGELVDIVRTGLIYFKSISPKTYKALRAWCVVTENEIEHSMHHSYMPKIPDLDLEDM